MMSESLPEEVQELEEFVPPSRFAKAIGRLTLTAGRYPGRQYIGALHRKVSRERGGRRFKVYRPNDVVLDAWYSPRNEGTPARLPIVFSHGLLETKERHFKLAWRMNARGHDVLLFDHRVHGRSTGQRLTFGVEEKHDVAAVIDRAVSRGWVTDKVITMGFSLGGGTVLQHAAIDDRVAGVIALAPFGDFRSAIESFRQKLAPWLDQKWVRDGFSAASIEAGFKMDEASALEAFKNIDVPVLLAEGGKDPFLPGVDHVHQLVAAKPDSELTLVCIDDATHNTLVHKHWPKLDRAIARFCRSLE